jgi:hypothetical protein
MDLAQTFLDADSSQADKEAAPARAMNTVHPANANKSPWAKPASVPPTARSARAGHPRYDKCSSSDKTPTAHAGSLAPSASWRP